MRSRGKLEGKSDAGPQYLVLRDQMALNIELGKLPAGTRLPSERKLQSDSGAARGTVREALFQLEAEQGRTPSTETLSKTIVPATAALADIFRIAPGTQLYDIRRRRSVDGRPVLVETIYIDPTRAPGLIDHSLDDSITRILSTSYDLTVARNRVDMCPCALVKQAADALGVKPGTPGLLVVRTSLSADGRVVEYDHEYWRHDAIRVHVDLQVT